MPQIVAASREVVGENPFTVIFDRGGYDSKLFTWLNEVGIDFITYQRGEANLAAEGFRPREALLRAVGCGCRSSRTGSRSRAAAPGGGSWWLLERLARHHPNAHDARALLRSFAELPGEIRTTAQGVAVTLAPPRHPSLPPRPPRPLRRPQSACPHLPGDRLTGHLPARRAPLRDASASLDVQTPESGGLDNYSKLQISNRA
jgi:hypothetical protein